MVDYGYRIFKGFLGPYKNTRYHLPQFKSQHLEYRTLLLSDHVMKILIIIIQVKECYRKNLWSLQGKVEDFAKYDQLLA